MGSWSQCRIFLQICSGVRIPHRWSVRGSGTEPNQNPVTLSPVQPGTQRQRGNAPHTSRLQTMRHTENATLLSVFSLTPVFLLCGRMLPWWWLVFRGVTGKPTYYWALRVRCAEMPFDRDLSFWTE